MGELTPCNCCTLRRIRQKARKEGNLAILRDSVCEEFPSGKEVFVYPPGIKNNERSEKKYKVAWFAELTNHCVC